MPDASKFNATGRGFPDALAGGPAAEAEGVKTQYSLKAELTPAVRRLNMAFLCTLSSSLLELVMGRG